jgi:hypothetical protein
MAGDECHFNAVSFLEGTEGIASDAGGERERRRSGVHMRRRSLDAYTAATALVLFGRSWETNGGNGPAGLCWPCGYVSC